MPGEPWTQQDERTLTELYEAGNTAPAIAKQMRRTLASINSKINWLGIRDGKKTQRYDWHAKYEKAVEKLGEAVRREKELEANLVQVQRQLHSARQRKLTLPTGGKKTSRKGSFCRVLAGDFHGCLVDREVLKALLADLELIQPAEFIWGGDVIDCGGFLAQHHTLAYVADTEYSYADDVEAGNEILDAVASKLPQGCRQRFVEGNHEARIERWIVDQTHNMKDASKLREVWGPEVQLNLAKRGIAFHSQGAKHDNLPSRGCIDLGKSWCVHGAYHNSNATEKHARQFGHNVVHFHTHRPDSKAVTTAAHGIHYGWCPGCMCELHPTWQHSKPTQWGHGYHLQAVQADGSFLGINIPIIDGKSYLAPLASNLGAA